MKAVCWCGVNAVHVENVPDPKIINPRDAVVRVTATAICGSDLHLYDGFIPGMKKGDILGHEFMGEVVEVGPAVTTVRPGDRVVVPFAIACGHCFYCKRDLWSLCDNSNPNARACEKLYGHSGSGLFGYSHLFGGYAGGQAEAVRVPFADVGCFKVPASLPDEKVLFLTDILPTAYMAAENCGIQPGDVVAVWGCGPVGLLTVKCAFLLGAERVLAIDRFAERLRMAGACGAEPIDYTRVDLLDELAARTGGRGPDCCVDAVGMEAHGVGLAGWYDPIKVMLLQQTDRAYALRQVLQACRKGGTVSIPGVYGGLIDKFNFGAAFAKGLTLRMGQTHVHRYVPLLLQLIEEGTLDPSFIITHRGRLDDAPRLYETFKRKQDQCIKCVLRP